MNQEFIPNFTQYPNEILDNWMPHLSGNQVKIMNVFVRQIYGFHKQYDKISIRQIAQKTGITSSGVFKDLKILLSLGCIKILKKGNNKDASIYQIINITEVLSKKERKTNREGGVIGEITGCYSRDNAGVIGEITGVLSEREQQNKRNKEIKCEIKGVTENLEHTHAINRDIIQKTSLNQPEAHINPSGIPKVEGIFPDRLKIDSIDNSAIEQKYELQIRDINTKYENILGQVPKLTTTELIGNSEKLMQSLGIGFDDNPRRILNKIYNSLPNDHRIMEDARDVEVVRDFIAKYKSANPETRSALSKRLYQALELMIKIYYIKKFGEEFRGKLYPEILDKNLVLYLNCNPTLKYCLGGFSNDIDGVYDEVKRLIDKKNKKILDEIQEEKQKELDRLEAYRKTEEYNSIPENERIDWQNRLHNIFTKKSNTETINYIQQRTQSEEQEYIDLKEKAADCFRNNIKPDIWITERIRELANKRGYYEG